MKIKPENLTINQVDGSTVYSHGYKPTKDDLNSYALLHGGEWLKLVDEFAGSVAYRYNDYHSLTLLSEVKLGKPVRLEDELVFEGRVVRTWNTSLEVSISIFRMLGHSKELVGRAYFVMVAVDDNLKPRPVRPFLPRTETEKLLARLADGRRWRRKREAEENDNA